MASGSGTGALVTVDFPAQNARYVKVVQTGASTSWWSIAEFNAYTSGGSSGGGGTSVLSRTGWSASASSTGGGDVPANMLDGVAGSRWSSGVPMAAGQSVTVDTGAVRSLARITMDSGGSANDYARGYQVFLSSDGVSWGSAVASGSGTGALVTVDFPAQNARYVKVVQTGASTSWWSIAEFNAYTSGGSSGGGGTSVLSRTGWSASASSTGGVTFRRTCWTGWPVRGGRRACRWRRGSR